MSSDPNYPILSRIDSPTDLRRYDESMLPEIADELRQFLIHTLSDVGGHFAAGLGTVELTVALHYVFNTPDDRLVWDVGHQTYPHKVLTGRRDRLHTIRQKGGLAPFCKPAESEYDAFGAGHSSTSIGIALGMAIAAAKQNIKRKSVAIIGDGGMSAGMAFEALNHAGHTDYDMLVVLNDNDMSISENVGALNSYFARILSGHAYSNIRRGTKRALQALPSAMELARRSEELVKGLVTPGMLFEELGFNYIGPVDGHDVNGLVSTLKNMKDLSGPQFLHVVTTKGAGFAPAEEDPIKYHGVGKFDPNTGAMPKKAAGKPTFTQIFSDWLVDAAERDDKVVGITPAMREGSGLVEFSKKFPDRYFDVGIAEQHAVTVSAGMAADGLKPICAIYSSFLQRGYDQLIHDVAIPNLPVVFAIDRAGVVGADGPTHAGSFDLSFLRCIPNMTVMAPANEAECRAMLNTALTIDGPTAVRYPRGAGMGVEVNRDNATLPVGKAEIRREGHGIAFLAFGVMLEPCLEAAEEIGATVVNMRFVKPLDVETLVDIATRHETLVTVEDNVIAGGAGSAVIEALSAMNLHDQVIQLGQPDRNVEHATREEMLTEVGLDAAGILRSVGHLADSLHHREAV